MSAPQASEQFSKFSSGLIFERLHPPQTFHKHEPTYLITLHEV